MGTSMITFLRLLRKTGELLSAVICDHFLGFQWVEFQPETESFQRQGTSRDKGDVNERPGPVGHRLVGGGSPWTSILHMVFFSKKKLCLYCQRTVKTQKSNKRSMVGTITGDEKREGQRKAKRPTAHTNQKKGES
jgi:hypothetical protein